MYTCIIKTVYGPASWLFNDSIYAFMKCLYNARSDFESHLNLQIRREKTVGKLQKTQQMAHISLGCNLFVMY